jgi:hypothetical protein
MELALWLGDETDEPLPTCMDDLPVTVRGHSITVTVRLL